MKGYNKSDFCSKTKMKAIFEKMIKDVKCKYLLLSYNNEGIIEEKDLKEILIKKGDLKLFKIKYNKFKAQKSVKVKYTIEYVWFINVKESNEEVQNKYEEIELELVK